MNLIEQLGGYDKAKEMYIAQLKAGLAPYGYEEALLEYRRQHNIFEVGDKVVCISDPISPDEFEILTVEQEHIGKWYMRYWKHATDLEIQAGRRL